MKILIAGDSARGKQWERHLRKIAAVKEVIITSAVKNEPVDAVILLDNSESNLEHLLGVLRKGYPAYLVSDLPLNTEMLERIYHASEESNAGVQFSHWPSFTGLARWIRKKMPESPLLIDIDKSDRNRSLPDPLLFKIAWAEELAMILTLQKSHVQDSTVLPVQFNGKLAGIHLTVRFNSGAVGSMRYVAVSPSEIHKSIIHSKNELFYCNMKDSSATCYSKGMDTYSVLNTDAVSFDPATTVSTSIEMFIRSVRTHKPSGFSASDALQTARLTDKIINQMKVF